MQFEKSLLGRMTVIFYRCVVACFLSLACIATVDAQAVSPATPITLQDQKLVVANLGKQLEGNYVFPDVAAKVAASISAKAARGDYASHATADEFAKALTRDLRESGNDRHFFVTYDPTFKPDPPDGVSPSKESLNEERKAVEHFAFGIAKVERLPGNVGYLDIRGFFPADFAAGAYGSAMTLLSGTDALILDLRQNGGGDPAGVAALLSYFFAAGDDRHVNDLYWRAKGRTQEFWTGPVQGPRYSKPVYVLTSQATFSGGEECAYDFQTQKRATLIGQTTGGGANPGDMLPIGHGFIAFIPSGRAINPITKTNWEHVGVKPDITVPAADAMKTAYATILKSLISQSKDPDELKELKNTLARVEKGEEEKPDYSPPQP
jgi:hypothetical protein